MKKYILEMNILDKSGEITQQEQECFDTLVEANKKCEKDWWHLSDFNKKSQEYIVCEVTENDLDDYATDDETCKIDWCCYHSYNIPKGALMFNKSGAFVYDGKDYVLQKDDAEKEEK